MRNGYLIIIGSVWICVVLMSLTWKEKETDYCKKADYYFRNGSKEFHENFKKLKILNDQGADALIIQNQYKIVRHFYKRIELFTGYFTDLTEKQLNGPLINEVDPDDGTQTVLIPQGMQLIESLIYGELNDSTRLVLSSEIQRSLGASNKLIQVSESYQILDWQLLEAIRNQIIRISALGIAGFDSPASGNAIMEAASSWSGIAEVYAFMKPYIASKKLKRKINSVLRNGNNYLLKNTDFDVFNRYYFIKNYANPLFGLFKELGDDLNIKPMEMPMAIRWDAVSMIGNNTFEKEYFKSDYKSFINSKDDLIKLGNILFFDPVLSGNGERSCASCHKPELAFSDGLTTSISFNFKGNLRRNSPSLINVGLQQAYFWDSRVNYLEDQVMDVTKNKNELHGNFEEIVKILEKSKEYKELFKKAFAGSKYEIISAEGIRIAIAEFERSLIALNSDFDKSINQPKNLISDDAIAGFNLFMGKALCGTCHFFPIFNGTVPPKFNKTEWEVIGVPGNSDFNKPEMDLDSGRYLVYGKSLHQFAFKTSGVRNMSKTGPYMHNGVYTSLADVVKFYNLGGGQGLGLPIENQTLPFDSLSLNEKEINQIVSFLETLNDNQVNYFVPDFLPRIEGEEALNNRKVGGNY